jgi:DNA polymerase III alpha subunit|tara:strand:+ start:1093 stop:1614 length:522 start_codon:yes stop_codon:yes gene_type:complete
MYNDVMFKNTYGQPVYTEENLFDFYMRTPDLILKNTLTDSKITIDDSLELKNIPELIKETLNNLSVEEFDENNRLNWFMPEEYQTFDIAKFVLDQCTHEEELQRAGKELLIFEKRGLFTLLQYMKYLVDLMRENNIVWGVGRGSSVSSFVLFLIGIHRINSLYYDLNVEEFLK